MNTFVEEQSIGASTNATMKAPIEEAPMKDFVEAFMEVMEVFAEVMGDFTESTSTEVFVDAIVKASMEGLKDMKAFRQVTYTGACTKA